ncbi:metallophosphoesterase [Mucilaginibacter sp. L3T2-6]|uniref:metallophosphoesterase n=1 Tax=Mucilaginibacter sp. L3T2-6 TaxID=3062491 RepID=UPI002674F61A|nr:metallophosphoesterase [Mucilaginibacter sp. L3T2-6]MDO3641186.1 metallophosphoesterase [Mucilaginibacter sp. L3T2-6]MDV6213338.1 metallophosphoesterase [Mucilaginibacter sp. L3T2-6]
MKPITIFICACILSICSSCHGHKHEEETVSAVATGGHCLFISDMHFNPFYTNDGKHNIDVNLRDVLAATDIAKWDSILTAYNGTKLDTVRGYDSDYNLIKSAMNNISTTYPKPDFIVITGDFLFHSYYNNTDSIPFKSPQQERLLRFKTMAYLAGLFRQKFAGIPVIPAFGNNDTDNGDYVFPTDAFLSAYLKDWNLVSSPAGKLKVDTSTIHTGGYYRAQLGNQLFLSLNTTLLSNNKSATHKGDTAMLTWLDKQLAAASGQNIWIVSHVPPGDDFWLPQYTPRLTSIIKKRSKNIKMYLAAHTHFNDLRAIYKDSTTQYAFVRMVSSITADHDNTPGYIYADFDQNGLVTNETQHYLDYKSQTWKTGFGIGRLNMGDVNASNVYKFLQKTQDPFKSTPYIQFHSLDSINRDSYLKQSFAPNLLQVQ